MRFDWTDLRVFLHACDTGSMTQAAERAHLTLAAVSARIRALEDDAGVQLLRRHARGVQVTAAGAALARHARLVLQQVDAMRRDLAAGAGAPRATLLRVNSAALLRPLHQVLAGVLAEHPDARLQLRESSSELTVHALHAGAAEVGIVSDAVRVDGLATEALGPDPLVLVAPPVHPLAARTTVRFAEALAHDWIAGAEDGALHTHLLLHACRAGASLRVRASCPAPEGVLELVARGFGLAVLPRAALGRFGTASQVVAVDLDEAWARRRLLVCRRADCVDPPALACYAALRARWSALERTLVAPTGAARQLA